MDASALEKAILSLEIRSDSLESRLLIWIVFVVLGLAIEVYVVIHGHLDAVKAYRLGSIRSPDKPLIRSTSRLTNTVTLHSHTAHSAQMARLIQAARTCADELRRALPSSLRTGSAAHRSVADRRLVPKPTWRTRRAEL